MMMIVCMLLGLSLSSCNAHNSRGETYLSLFSLEKAIGSRASLVRLDLSASALLGCSRNVSVVGSLIVVNVINATTHWAHGRRYGARESVTGWILRVILDQHVCLKTLGHWAQPSPPGTLDWNSNVLGVDLERST